MKIKITTYEESLILIWHADRKAVGELENIINIKNILLYIKYMNLFKLNGLIQNKTDKIISSKLKNNSNTNIDFQCKLNHKNKEDKYYLISNKFNNYHNIKDDYIESQFKINNIGNNKPIFLINNNF